ncbi:hypothetical protein [Thermostichus sp. OS-CIW-26]
MSGSPPLRPAEPSVTGFAALKARHVLLAFLVINLGVGLGAIALAQLFHLPCKLPDSDR